MIGPVSGTGRAMMASLQQAMSKGMPPDQAIQYVKGMATQGVAPLADLYAMMNQFQRLKQQQVQPPQTPPTIKDQLNMADQQQQMQAQQGGIAGMQAPPPAGQPMDRGLGAIDAGRMEYPQFAGGGIVAFSAGGTGSTKPYEFNDDLEAQVPSFMNEDMDIVSFVRKQMPNFDTLSADQKAQVLKQFEPVYMRARAARNTLEQRGVAGPVEAAPAPLSSEKPAPDMPFRATSPFASPDENLQGVFSQMATRPATPPVQEAKPAAPARPRVAQTAPKGDVFTQYEMETPDLAKIRAEREERQKATKTGAYSQADADLAAYIKEQKDKGGDEKQAYRNFWVMTGASLMANKSPSFLGALGESVKENYGGLVRDLKTLKDESKQLRLQEIQLRRAQEQAMESGSQADQDRFDVLNERARNTNFKILEARVGIQQKVLDRQHDLTLAELRRYGNEKAVDELNKLWKDAISETDPSKKEQKMDYYEQYREAMRQNTIATTAGGVSAEIRADIAADTRLANLAKNPMYSRMQRLAQNAKTEKERDDALQAMRVMEAQAVGTMGAGPRIAQDQGLTGGAYTGPYSSSGWDQ